jgi:hypothetical protein
MSDLPADTLTTTIEALAQAARPDLWLGTPDGEDAWVDSERNALRGRLAAAVVSVLATHNEHTAADAWDEGYAAGAADWDGIELLPAEIARAANPYRLAAVSPTPPTHKEPS